MKPGKDHIGISVVHFCHDGNGKVLMHRRNQNCNDEHGCWDNGGGKLEFGETIEQTLKREVKEEYCCDIINYTFVGYEDVLRKQDGIDTHFVAILFFVQIDPKQVENGEPHKHEDLTWFPFDDLPTPLHSYLPESIALLKRHKFI